MKAIKNAFFLLVLLIGILTHRDLSAQTQADYYRVRSGESESILIENGQLYRITISSCWYSAEAFIGTYLIYGLNISDPKTEGRPTILVVAETPNIDWRLSFRLNGSYDAEMKITSQRRGDQGLNIVVERLSNGMYQNRPDERNYRH